MMFMALILRTKFEETILFMDSDYNVRRIDYNEEFLDRLLSIHVYLVDIAKRQEEIIGILKEIPPEDSNDNFRQRVKVLDEKVASVKADTIARLFVKNKD
jgi:hypothetical protein